MPEEGQGKRGAPPSPLPLKLADEIRDETLTDLLEIEETLQGDISRAGTLDETPIARLLFEVYAIGLNGGLLLTQDATKKLVFFRSGYPIAAKSNVSAECLGKLLAWDGVISEEQLRESLVVMNQTNQRQGSVLLDLGVLNHDQLLEGLSLQARFRICEVFAWTAGAYKLWPGIKPPADATTLELSPASLIFEGVRSFMPHKRVLEELRPHIGSYLHPSTNPLWRFQLLDIRQEAEPLLERIDGTTTVEQLLRKSPLSVPETSALLYTVLLTEMASPAPEPEKHWSDLRTVMPRSGAESSTKQSSARVLLARLVERLQNRSPYEVLGVPDDAPLPTLLRAYRRHAAERHPDRLGVNQSEGLRTLAVQALNMTAEAFSVVSRPYLEPSEEHETVEDDAVTYGGSSLLLSPLPEVVEVIKEVETDINDRVRMIIEAERHHQRGLELLDKGRFDEAARVLARAVSACDEEGEFRASLAWAIFQDGLDDSAARHALEHLDEAVLTSRSARPHNYRGHILHFLGRDEEAGWAFEDALRKEPTNEEARSELERLRES